MCTQEESNAIEEPMLVPPAVDEPAEPPKLDSEARAYDAYMTRNILSEITELSHHMLSPYDAIPWIQGLRSFAASHGGLVTFATAFSGCDIISKVLRCLSQVFESCFAVELSFRHAWACESDAMKRSFLASQVAPGRLFEDFEVVSQKDSALDVLTGTSQLVEYAPLVFAGFPCTSKSSLNRNRGSNTMCVKDGTAATGKGFQAILRFVEKATPEVIILENVPQIATEEEYIKSEMNNRGFWCKCSEFDASAYGSCPVRKRWYLFAVKVGSRHVETNVSDLWTMMHMRFLNGLRTEPLQPDIFVVREEHRDSVSKALGFSFEEEAVRLPKIAKTDCNYKDEHFELYRSKGYRWPLDLSNCTEFDGYMVQLGGLVPRQAECVVFLHRTFEAASAYEFVDVNQGLGMMTNYKAKMDLVDEVELRNPWRPRPNALVGSCCVMVRIKSEKLIRPLEGFEYMAMIGWSPCEWRRNVGDMPSRSLCSNMAGNAFSAFALGPLVSASLAVAGMTHTWMETQVPPDRVTRDADSYEDSGHSDVSDTA